MKLQSSTSSQPVPRAPETLGARPDSGQPHQRLSSLSLVLLCALSACGDNPSPPTSAAASAESAASAPVQLSDRLEVNTRLIELKNLIQLDPYSASARFGLGELFLSLGDPRAAEKELSQAMELGMDVNRVLPVLARTWNLLGKSSKLISTHGQTVLSDPQASAELNVARALAHAKQGDPASARKAAAAALQDHPDSVNARVLQAQIKLSDGEVDAAMRSVNQILDERPDTKEAWDLKGDVLLMVQRDRAGAIAAYEEVLRIAPRELPVHAKLIAMALGARDLGAAQARWAVLRAVSPDALPTRYFQARLAYAQGDVEAARATITRTLTEYPGDLRSLLLSAELDLNAGALRAAEKSLAVALTNFPSSAPARHLLAHTFLRMGTPEKAQLMLEPLVRSGSRDATALGLAAEAAFQSGLTFVAARLYEQAAAARPDNMRFRAAAAMARIAKGEVQEGFDQLEAAASRDSTAYADLALMSAHLRAGDLRSALLSAQSVLNKRPGLPMSHLAMGQLLLRNAEPQQARVQFEQALKIDPAYVPAASALAALDLQADDAASARSRFQGVLKLNPSHLDARLALAEIAHQAGEDGAIVTAAFEEAVRLHPKQSRARAALINHMLRIGDPPAALLVAQTATNQLPDEVELLDALGRAQMESGESAQALSTFRKIVTLRPRSAEPHVRMADVYAARGEIDSAQEALRQAIRVKPEMLSAHTKLVELTTARRDFQAALRSAREVQRRFPKDPTGFHLEGLVHAAQRDWPAAIDAFEQAAQRGSSSELAVQLHGATLANGKSEQAARMAKDWLLKRPRDHYFRGYLGETALLKRDLAAAESHFRRILQDDGRNIDALNNLAWVLAEQAKPEAVEVAQRAVELRPRRADVVDTLARALAVNGRLPSALETQRRAVTLSPGMPVLRLHLAELALKSKDYALARTELDTLSAMGKAFAGQEEVWRLRQQLP